MTLARAWGALATPLRLIAARENKVYEARFESGLRAALRVHRPGYQSAEAIASELRWTEALAIDGFPCPAPIRTSAGALTVHGAAGALVSLVSWMEGQPASEVTLDLAHFEALGAAIARLHTATDRVAPAEMQRPAWDLEGFLGEAPLWGRFWENPALSAEDRALVDAARAAARERLDALAPVDFGLIHADLLPENVFVTPKGLAILDFDDSGFGYRGYDLGTALIRYWGTDGYAAQRDALLRGYAVRRVVPVAEVELFVMLRAFASAGWILSRKPAGDPLVARYAARAATLARAYLADGSA